MGIDVRSKFGRQRARSRFARMRMPMGGVRKRGFDIAFSALAIASMLPLLLVVAVCVRLLSRGPIFFVHERIGFGGAPFGCVKFRTMYIDADARLQTLLAQDPAAAREWARDRKIKNDPRIIPGVGTFLRKTSLDELPQFFNVLVGHMSVVGPRPVPRDEYEQYGPVKSAYARTRPGITGLWQVSGRNDVSFSGRVQIDKRYVSSWSMAQDLQIIFKTFEVVLRRDGAY